MSNALTDNWQYTTLCIEDDLGKIVGTGVLVAKTVEKQDEYGGRSATWEPSQTRIYLATARHVLGNNASVIRETLRYGLRYTRHQNGKLVAAVGDFAVKNEPPNWAVHPDPEIDVAVLDVTDWVRANPDAYLRVCPLSELANPLNLLHVDCEAGDDVCVLGYPLTLRQGRTSLPIFRKGALATSPQRALEENDRPLRGFLVDGAIMPGSSGSPVVSLSIRFRHGDMAVTPHRALLLGIVAQEWGRGSLRYDASAGHGVPRIEGYANLGFAHSASTIIETILTFGQYSVRDFLTMDRDQHWSPSLGVEEWSLEFSGQEVSGDVAHRIMMRLHRDRMRDRGHYVEPNEYLDIPSMMGPVRTQERAPLRGRSIADALTARLPGGKP